MGELKRLWVPDNEIEVPNIAIALSGKGSNGVRIVEHMLEKLEKDGKVPYNVVCFFSDNPGSNCVKIVNDFRERGLKLENLVLDIKRHYRKRKEKLSNMDVRREYDAIVANFFREVGVDIVCLAGYMKTVTDFLTDNFLVLNVHPADLRVVDELGNRKYTGDHAVRTAILNGATILRSSVHKVEYDHIDPTHLLDKGALIGVSANFEPVVLPYGFNYGVPGWLEENSLLVDKVSDEHQDRLKIVGDLKVYPAALEFVATRNVTMDYSVPKDKRIIYLDGKPCPDGLMLGV